MLQGAQKGPKNSSADRLWKPHPWVGVLQGLYSDSGLPITLESAIGHTPLWQAIMILGGDVGSLKFQQKQRKGDQLEIVTNHVAWELMGDRPNSLMRPANFWEAMILRAIIFGNALCEIDRNAFGRPTPVSDGGGLKMLVPEYTFPWFDESGKLWIETRDIMPNGRPAEKRKIDPDDVYHVCSMSTDGFWGRALLDVAKNRLGNGLGLERQHNRMMQNGMMPDWLFSFPEHLGEEAINNLEHRFDRRNRGLDNTGRTLILDEGPKATQLGMSFEAAQFTDLVKLDVQMVASLTGVPPTMLGLMDKMTFDNVEESERHYVN